MSVESPVTLYLESKFYPKTCMLVSERTFQEHLPVPERFAPTSIHVFGTHVDMYGGTIPPVCVRLDP